MSKLKVKLVVTTDHLNLKFIKVKGEEKLKMIIIKIDMKVGIDQTVAIGECHIEEEVSMDKTLEEGHSAIKIMEVTL